MFNCCGSLAHVQMSPCSPILGYWLVEGVSMCSVLAFWQAVSHEKSLLTYVSSAEERRSDSFPFL